MKSFVIFFMVALSIYLTFNVYIYWRGFSALSGEGSWIIWLKVLFIALVLTFPVSILFRGTTLCKLCDWLTVIGSVWVGAMVYFLLIAVCFDILITIDRFIPFISSIVKDGRILAGRVVFFGSIVAVVLIMLGGWVNTRFIRVSDITLDMPKLAAANNPTTVVFVSDLHLGRIIHEGELTRFVEKINEQHPDIILIGGDLVDESVEGLDGMPDILAGLTATDGVYAVLGNHEFYAGHDKAEAFMKSAGIRVLRDEIVTLPGLVNIVGLDDPTALRFGKTKEVSVGDLVGKGDPGLTTILMYHPPIRMKEYSGYGVDLMLSGHSHHGQFFPVNLITDMIYLVSYGQKQVGPMQVYVSSGLGTWGPPIRVMTHPEIVKITLVNEGEKR